MPHWPLNRLNILWCLFRAVGVSLWAVFLLCSCQPRRLPPSQEIVKAQASYPLIVIDPGHGGRDLGAVNARLGLCEKDMCLTTARLVERKLQAKGYRTHMLRVCDEFVSLDKRVSLANQLRHSILISIHFNSAKNLKAEGIEVFYFRGAGDSKTHMMSQKLAVAILAGSLKTTHAPSRGVKEGSFRVIKSTHAPACLIEGGFLTNAKESKKLKRSNYIDSLAKGIVEGIETYCKQNSQTLLMNL